MNRIRKEIKNIREYLDCNIGSEIENLREDLIKNSTYMGDHEGKNKFVKLDKVSRIILLDQIASLERFRATVLEKISNIHSEEIKREGTLK